MSTVLEWLSSQHSLTLSGWVWAGLTCLGGILGFLFIGLSILAKFASDFIDAFIRR
jgi:hypothetical protein